MDASASSLCCSVFLRALFLSDFIDVRVLNLATPGAPPVFMKRVRVHCQDLKAIDHIARQYANYNIYMGVAERRTDKNGKAENCSAVNALWAGIDLKDYNHDEIKAVEKLRAFPLKPHIITKTGGGFHCYWLLAEPLLLT